MQTQAIIGARKDESCGTMKKKFFAAALAAVLTLSACGQQGEALPTADPYEGMVQVENGLGTKMWVRLVEGLEKSEFSEENFTIGRGYLGEGYECKRGVDVSEHQRVIDWASVASKSTMDFAILRAGYRGYSEGGLYRDAYFFENMDGCILNGLDIGVYFFSQATNEEEAVEEAEYLIELLSIYDPDTITLPVFYDWESIGVEAARTDDMDGEDITACAEAFCRTIEEAGYTAGIYAYRNLAYFSYDLEALSDYELWISAPGSYPDFYYAHDYWQYSMTGDIPGINGEVDINFRFIKTGE